MVSKKKNKQKPKMDNKTQRKGIPISAGLMPFLLLILCTLVLSVASIAIVQQVISDTTQEKAQQIHLQTVADSTISLLSIRFSYTYRQLESLANDANLIKTLKSNNEEAIRALTQIIQSSFNDSLSLRIIPWDQTATVGLKNRGIEMRNSIET